MNLRRTSSICLRVLGSFAARTALSASWRPCGDLASLEMVLKSDAMWAARYPEDLRGTQDPPAQLVPAAGCDGTRGAALVEGDAAGLGELEQLLALLPLARGAQEEPAAERQR